MTTSSDTILAIRNLYISFDEQQVINGLSLSLEKGEIGCLLGASGCGKTSVLRAVAGFECPASGKIMIDGCTVSSERGILSPDKRSIAMVFQDYALFPHLSVFDNVAFGLQKMSKKKKIERVMDMLDLVDLHASEESFPHELSGGQQQRVALARALAVKPCLLLMDEPFSNLDVTLRERLSEEVRQILKKAKITTLFVTHNQQEAFALADKIGVMKDGKICQWGTSFALYHSPLDTYVAGFIGEGRLIQGRITGDNSVQTGIGRFIVPEKSRNCSPGQKVTMLIRPEDVMHEEESALRAEVLQRTFRGAGIMYELQIEGKERIQALVPSGCDHSPGELIGIRPNVRHVVLFSSNCSTKNKSSGFQARC